MISSGFVLSRIWFPRAWAKGSEPTYIIRSWISPFWSCSASYSKRLLRCWVQSLSSFTYPASPTWHKPWIQKLPLSFCDSIHSRPDSRPLIAFFYSVVSLHWSCWIFEVWRKAASLGQMELEKQRSVFRPPPAMLRWFRTSGRIQGSLFAWVDTNTHTHQCSSCLLKEGARS